MMEKLTRREEELMRCFWEHGPLFVRELVALATEPKPHFNTLSTMVRALEAKGYVAHNTFGSTYQYYPVVTEEEFSRRTLGGVISKYFENSYLGAVSALVEEEKISVDELRELIARIGAQSREEYLQSIQEAKEILKGNTAEISRNMLAEMQALAAEMRFEEAQAIKRKYDLLESYSSKSEVVSNVLHNIDVFSIEDDGNAAYINY